jgi:hypothetical protein
MDHLANYKKIGMVVIFILILFSVFLTALIIAYHHGQDSLMMKFADIVFDESLNLSGEAPDIHSLYKNIAVTHGVLKMLFLVVTAINYITISIAFVLIWRSKRRL